MKLTDIMSPESPTHSRQMRITQEAGTAWATYEVEVITKDNQRVPLEVSTRGSTERASPLGCKALAAT